MNKPKICLISSSGGHYEQLKMLKGLNKNYPVYIVTEKTKYPEGADYKLLSGSNSKIISVLHLIETFSNPQQSWGDQRTLGAMHGVTE